MANEQRFLHRYRSLSEGAATFVQKIVDANELYFAKPVAFNDPFDCRPSFSMEAPKAQLRRYYEGLYSRHEPMMGRAARRAESKQIARDPRRNPASPQNLADFKKSYHESVTDRIGLVCLSEVADDLLMWSHYADSHRGICLAFDWQTEFFSQAQPVIYQKTRPHVNPIFQTHEEMLEHALLTKSDHWKYEKEWRIIQYRKGAGAYKFPPEALVGVILGSQISPADRALVVGWLAARQVPASLFQASLSDVAFSVNIAPCTP
jgi:hypothetical protein